MNVARAAVDPSTDAPTDRRIDVTDLPANRVREFVGTTERALYLERRGARTFLVTEY